MIPWDELDTTVSSLQLEGYRSVDGYNVTVAKESREFQQVLFTSQSSLRLLLSDSAHVISIVAFNQAGASPPATTSVQAADDAGIEAFPAAT